MVAIYTPTPELVRLDAVREILQHPGPCITIYLPPYRPGEPSGSPAAVLKSYVHEAETDLAARTVPAPVIAKMLAPLEQMANDTASAAGSRFSRVIFRSPAVLQQFDLVSRVAGGLTIGGSFAIRKLAQEFTRPREFFVLALKKDRIALFACASHKIERATLPLFIPETLEEALALEPPDHDLENRAAIGSSQGAMHGVRFGTGSGRERAHTHLADYYKLVDHGLQTFVGVGIPLILAGVGEDIALYRNASTFHGLAEEAIVGSPDLSAHDQILEQAYGILNRAEIERQSEALRRTIERVTPARMWTDPDRILYAAFEGRVGQLYLNRDAVRLDVFERGKYHSWGKEDLLNLAMVQTLLHNGNTCELPPDAMPNSSVAAGFVRF